MQGLISRNETPNDIWDQIRQLETDVANIRNALPGIPGTDPGQLAYWGDNGQIVGHVNSRSRGSTVPLGVIALWYSAIADIPLGWTLCNGDTVNGLVTPDLRNVFVVGAGDTYAVDATGGSITKDISHTHDVTGRTAFDGHGHGITGNTGSAGGHDHGGKTDTYTTPETLYGAASAADFNSLDPDHTHDLDSVANHTHDDGDLAAASDSHRHDDGDLAAATGGSTTQNILPPYRALAFVMRVG